MWLGSWTRWWISKIKVNPTRVYDQLGRPVYPLSSIAKLVNDFFLDAFQFCVSQTPIEDRVSRELLT